MPSLTRKLFWLAFWVVGFAVAMTGLLLHFKYQSAFAGLQRDRVLLVAREIDEIAERDLSLGQDFWSIETLPDVLARGRAAESFFEGIEVAGADGRVAYSTDPARIGSRLPEDWVAAFTRATGHASLAPSPDLAVVASPIRNGFDQLSGWTVVRYGRTAEHEAVAAFTRELLFIGGATWAGFTLLLFVVLVLMRQRIERVFLRAADHLAGGGAAPKALAPELERVQGELAEAEAMLAAAHPAGPAR